MRNRNEDAPDDEQTKFGDMLMPRIGQSDADAEQAEQVREMLIGQAEMQNTQLLTMKTQIVHMLVLSMRVLSRIEDIPDIEKANLIAKMIVAVNQQLGVLPGEKGTTPTDKPSRGMGFGSA